MTLYQHTENKGIIMTPGALPEKKIPKMKDEPTISMKTQGRVTICPAVNALF
jgi:hypothetical protein